MGVPEVEATVSGQVHTKRSERTWDPASRIVTGPPELARRWLHLPIDVKAREFDARIFLACVAVEQGFGCIVGAQGHLGKAAAELPAGIRLEKTAQLKNLRGLEVRDRLGYVNCCIDEEGLVYINPEAYTGGRLGRPVVDLMDRIFTWGADQAEILAQWHPAIENRIHLTGNPRVDLWRPEMRAFYQDEADALRARFGQFVLFSTAFAMVNNDHGDDFFAQTLHSNGGLDDDGKQHVEGYIAHSRRLFEAMRTCVVDVARSRPAQAFVVRPHPSEDVEVWRRTCADLPNVEVHREGPVTPWLMAAQAVIHNNSTTGLESTLLGRPTIAYTPYVDPDFDQNLPNRVSHRADDVDAVVELVDDLDRAESWTVSEDDLGFLARHVDALDGPFSAERIVEHLRDIDIPARPFDGGVARSVRAKIKLAPLRVARRLGLHYKVPAYPDSTKSIPAGAEQFPATTIEEVATVIERLDAVTGRFGDVVCRELGERFWVIEPSR